MTLRLGLICPEVAGHLNPLSTLGGELRQRGHQITLIAPPSKSSYADREQLNFVPIGIPEDESGELAERWNRLGQGSGLFAMRKTSRVLYASSLITHRDLPEILQQHQFDGLLVDQFSPGAAVVANQRGLPFVITCDALMSNFDWRVPPPNVLWRFRDNLWGRFRHSFAQNLSPLAFWFISRQHGGTHPAFLVYHQQHGLAQIAQQPAFFDYPRDKLPDHFHYTGPWHRPDRDDNISFDWKRLDGRPLVYASMGTLQNRLVPVFRAIGETVRGLNVQMVLTLGGSPMTLEGLPENVVVTPRAPQLRLLEKAAVAITHAGLNTALECIVRGVPMVCLPITNDQPGVARRVEWLGLGKVQNASTLKTERLRKELRDVLEEPWYHDNAVRYRQLVAKTNGLELACQIVEEAFRTGKKVLRKATPQ